MTIEIEVKVTIEVILEDPHDIRELEQNSFIGQRNGKPVHGVIIDREYELFIDLASEKIRSYYELDTLLVVPTDYDTIVVEIGD